jgi:hypothetical protein
VPPGAYTAGWYELSPTPGELTFWVDHVEKYPKDSFPTDAVYGDLDHAGLRLITCGGEFDEEAGDYADNVVVFATLVGMH